MPTNDFNLTRNELIEQACLDVGLLADGETLSGQLLNDGIKRLNMIVREIDVAGKWLHAVASTPTSLTLVANTFTYQTTLATDILELVSASYRDATAQDHPLKILTLEQYEALSNKIGNGTPEFIYLTTHKTISSRRLYVYPALSSVNTQSVVTGTDAAAWKCIRSHTSDSTNRPITGANYLLYWESGGSGPSAWATGTSYTAPQLIRYWYKRPLYDFDASTDNPDLPQQWTRYLMFRLCADLPAGLSIQERTFYLKMAQGAYETIFPGERAQTNQYHDKAVYF